MTLIQTRFMVVGTYRTGSSALVHCLNLHPRIACGLEWTQGLMPWRALRMAEQSLAGDLTVLRPKHRKQMQPLFSPEKTVLGFKRLFRASNKWIVSPSFGPLLIDGLELHIRWLQKQRDIRIIHLIRNDNMAWLRSKAFSDASGKYSGTSYPDDLNVTVAPREAVRRVRAKEFIDGRLAALSQTNAYLRVDYESFAADNYSGTRRIVSFLGCDAASLSEPNMKGRIQSRPAHRIKNADQIQRALERLGDSSADR